MSPKDRKTGEAKDGSFSNNPFGALSVLRNNLAPGPSAAPTPESRGPSRAVVRLERKGRRGKEVTCVEQLELPSEALEEWLKELKHTLGCGGTIEDGVIVLQGDHRERLPSILTARGVKKISVG